MGDGGLRAELGYIILAILVLASLLFFVSSAKDNVGYWEEFYVREVVKVINLAEPGQEIYLDVTKASEIAFKKGRERDKMFVFDNERNEVSVSLKPNSGKSLRFFSDVKIVDYKVERASGGAETDRLYFVVVEDE